MPQSISLQPVDDWAEDRDPAFYGRYRLWFHAVTPRRESGSVLVPVRDGRSPSPEALAGPTHGNWPILPATVKEQESTGMTGGALWFDAVSPCYIDTRNLHRAVTMLAPVLSNTHLFVYSSGDNDDQWVDEIRIDDGVAVIDRWIAEPNAYEGFLPLCERLLEMRDYDTAFRRFVSYLHVTKVPAPAWEPAAAQMFSPGQTGEPQLRELVRNLASLDRERRVRARDRLARALELDPGNYLARDLLEGLAAK